MAISTLLGNVLSRSPMEAIQEHMQLVLEIVEALALFLAATQEGDWDKASEIQEKIVAREDDADNIKQQLRRQMSHRLLMPIARSDLLDLIAAQDKIAGGAKDIAGLMLGRNMAFPSKLDKPISSFAELAVQSTKAALEAITSTHNLLRSGFAAQEAREVERKIAEVERLERRSDKAQTKLRARLYKLEKDLQPVDAIFMYQLMVWLGNISDHAQTVSHKLLLISRS
ncbi:MAG: putative phosphate transport protein (TIGR00153 family) [Halieaceae bacterium]|jgi:predicted phosphate transport protein (TIGR00153 family)